LGIALERFARTAEAIGARASKLEKIALLADYLGTLDDADLVAAARFFTGSPFAARDRRTLAIGGRAIVNVARRVWEFDDDALTTAYRSTGDLGSALGSLLRPPRDPMLFADRLTPAALECFFREIGDVAGKSAGKRREAIFERILRAGHDPLATAYVIKIVTGDLRIGLREGLVLDAIARAFEADAAAVRRAVMAAGDVGAVALAAKRRTLETLRVGYGAPIGFMLASPIAYATEYKELAGANWIAEDKYDGIRAQAHVRGGEARLFSRRLNDVSASYPEITAALPRSLACDAILDGEILAMTQGRVLPFRYLQARLQRKSVDAELLRDVPLVYVVFDLLARSDELLIDEPLLRRRERLASVVTPGREIVVAAFARIDETVADDVNARFEAARELGNEGLVLKRSDSPYVPGRRGKWWLKLKRELATLDAVVIAVEWGHGKRANVLSDYTFAVRDGIQLLAIGKAYSGLTDAEIANLTPWFLEHRLPVENQREKARTYEIPVSPKVVIEVAFDVIARSDLHESGFALRFPRIVRLRDDKPPEEIDTLDRVREIYAAMLERESMSS
jgi:DNA ligase-1